MSRPVTQLVVGPVEHGVVAYALKVAAARPADTVVHVPDAASATASAARATGRLHLHVTDRLFGASATEAAGRLIPLMTGAGARGSTVSITLHDLPQPSDGTGFAARRAAYRDIVTAAGVVVVLSDHERGLLDELGTGVIGHVVPHGIDERSGAGGPTGHERDVGVLGFLYPGKGHLETLAAMRGLPASVGLVALGRASDGHEDLVPHLRDLAARQGRRWRLTGYLSDADLAVAVAGVAVPVANLQHVSSSGSMLAWTAAGRRPLVPRHRYTEELESRSPGSLALVDQDEWGRAIAAALADPGSTWLAADVRVRPTFADVGAMYDAVFDRC